MYIYFLKFWQIGINEGINSEWTMYCPVVKINILQHSELINI